MNESELLTFAALDGLAFAAERGLLNGVQQGPVSVGELGPLFEWIALSREGLLPFPYKTPWLSLNAAAPLIAALRSTRQQWICPMTGAIGLFRTPATWLDDDVKWIGFGLAAQRAATAAGFHRAIAGQFIGAIGEMVSNIYEHSNSPASGIVAFRADRKAFEFVVADSGIGVLESLRSCAAFHDLSDQGTALRLALTDSVSRFGVGVQHGHGFRPIFVGLANLSGLLRFRSGDHALVIDGQKIDMMYARTAQKTHVKGFLASIWCRQPGKSSSS